MVIHKVDSLQDYVSYIKKHPKELSVLKKDLLISVTSFFRDSQAFEALARRLIELFEGKQAGDTFRAWVPGCSTGEEAYSIAILVAEILGKNLGKYRVQIFATDIDEDSVQVARKGVYPVATVMEPDGRRFEKHFSLHDNTVTVKKHIRDMVILARQDLIKDTPFLHLDLISCRNLMIYLNSELQDKLLSLFQFSLNPEGLLFLGKSESINKRLDLFKTVDSRWKVYRRKERPATRIPKLMQSRHAAQLASYRANRTKRKDSGARNESELFDALLGLLDSCAVMTDENANILYIRGDVSPYFRFPEGTVSDSLNAVEVARPEIRYILQSLLHRSAKEETTFTSNRIALGGDGKGVQIKIGPLQKGVSLSRRMIVFTPVEAPKPASRRKASPEEIDHEQIRKLEQELEVTREHLQDTIEELETSSEELQSLNEELQSANEELQASNEELETSNEELQASNEELNTVNDELRAKSEEAAELMEDLKTSEKRYRLLVDNMNEALMLCELEYGRKNQPTDLIIKQANRALEQLISIDSQELPLRVGSAHLHELVTSDMLERFVDIAKGGNPQRFEIRLKALEKDLTLSVYNLADGRLGMVCHDETESKRAAEALEELNESLEQKIAERTELAEARSKQLQALSVQLIEAEERERQRIAQLLHDDLQQLLASAKLQLQAACANLPDMPELANVEELLDNSIGKARRLSHELSPPVLKHAGIVPALQWLADQMNEQFELDVQIEEDTEHQFENSSLSVFIFRAVQELLFNVVKHAGVKNARVGLSEAEGALIITVSDNGRGFSRDVMENVIEPTGFGLLSLKERARSIGGSLTIDSTPGQGSRLMLTVPLDLGKAEALHPVDKAVKKKAVKPLEHIAPVDTSGTRLILADDHKVMRQGLLQLVANQPGITVVGEAANGSQAVELARQLRPDVVIMDVSMPEMDGVEATRRIKAELPDVRVIGLSMYEDEQTARIMREAGAEIFISKTASSSELLKAIYKIAS